MVQRWVRRVAESLLVSPEVLAATPVIASAGIDPDLVCAVAGVQRLAELGPRNTRTVPLDALTGGASRLRTLRKALEQGVIVLFASDDATAAADFASSWSPGASPQDGHDLPADVAVRVGAAGVNGFDGANLSDGSGAVYALNVAQLLRHCLAHDEAATLEALRGMPTRRVHREALALIPDTAPVRRESALRRALLHPSLPVYAIVFVYSSLRVLPVALIREFHGSLLVLWAIDVITAVPYTWGVLAMLFDPRRRIRLIATATTITTFVVPYVYFWLNGKGYPPYVPIVIAVLTVSSMLLEANRYAQEKRLRRSYSRASVGSSRAVLEPTR